MKTFQRWMSRAVAAKQLSHADAAFELSHAELSAERSGGNTYLRFKAAGQRHNAEGAYVIDRVTAVLLREDASLVRVQRYHESNKPFVVGRRVAWVHEFRDAELASAAAVFYVVQSRLQVVRTPVRCELGPVDLVAESAIWPITAKRTEPSDLMNVDVALTSRRGERVEISISAESEVISRGVSFAAELYFLDGDGIAMTSAVASGSMLNGLAVEKTDAGLDRATAHNIRSLEVRTRIEAEILSEIGAIHLPEDCRIAR